MKNELGERNIELFLEEKLDAIDERLDRIDERLNQIEDDLYGIRIGDGRRFVVGGLETRVSDLESVVREALNGR